MNQIQSLLYAFDCIMGSTRDKQDILSKAIIEREERDENDLEYVFIRQPRKRRDNFKEEEKGRKLRSQPPKLCRMHPRLISK